jgi:hypothetical protein
LSALAAVGEISHDEWQRLKSHLEECAQCRSVFADVGEIHAKWLPEHPDFEISRDRESDQRRRQAILRRVSNNGARFSKAAQNPGRLPEAPLQSWRLIPAFAAGAVAVVVLGGALIAVQRLQHRLPGTAASVGGSIAVSRAVGPSQLAVALSQEAAQLREAKATLEEALRASQAEQATLRQQLEEQQHGSIGLAQDKVENARAIADLQQQLEVARANGAATQLELTKLRSAEATSEAVTAAQQQEIVSLNARLADQSASIEGERQLSSVGRDIRDLIAARNLHIIDVYDTDSRGKTTRAFGRVFYTEGKSLVFYAYDLSPGHANTDTYAFYVWGKKDGDPRLLRNLGPFAKDDQAQKRWVLTITDPKVLAEIDSVFVTLEPNDPKHASHPSGKRLLSAFLGTPANHP